MTKTRLHIDVTSLYDRRGRPVGITRVVKELALAVRQLSERNQAWRYEARFQRLVPVPWQELDSLFDEHRPPVSGTRPYLRKRQHLLPAIRRLWDAALSSARRLIRPLPFLRSFPLLGENDRFVFADYIHDSRRIAIYRDMMASGLGPPIFYCHDLIPVLFEQFVDGRTAGRFDDLLSLFLRKDTLLLCNSITTLNDIRRSRPDARCADDALIISPDCGLDDALSEGPSSLHLPELGQGYILYVSTIEIRKNHRVLLNAYERLREQGIGDLPKLVFVGQRGWLVDGLLDEIDAGTGSASHVLLLEQVNDAELRRLYQDALFTVYPSFYEGWGIPVSESLALGTFCLCSDRGALPQAGAGFVELLDPLDPELWADRINHYLRHPDQLDERKKALKIGYQSRRWADFRDDAKAALARA